MATDRWTRLQSLFETARVLGAADRQAFLDRECKGDPALRSDVESLLEADLAAGSYLTDAVHAAVDSFNRPETPLAEGTRLGAYRVLREIGRGGMGTVYLAERDDAAYEARVAIKVVKPDRATPELLARFRVERQILARLNHANIARLLDGGATPDDLPWLAMEFVEGEPIDRYCDRHQLEVNDRIRLVLDACAAVAHAHTNLVVHGDLKPGNILVTEEGRVRLVDFGIARLLDDAEPSGERTATAFRPLTPTHASPEQIAGEPVSTSTDVYALGVVLYELLTGHLPHAVRADSPLEFVKAIAETEPRRPVDVVFMEDRADGGRAITSAEVARARRTTPERLRRALAGDLDSILLMALRKQPERRYSSVEQLADDLRRHLERKPVRARPDTLRYRTGKFVARNLAVVAASAVAVLILVTVVSFYTTRLRSERDAVRAESAKAAEVASFLTGLFEINDPNRSRRQNVTARELLDRGAERIDADLGQQPAVRAAMLQAMGDAYRALALHDRAGPALDSALAIRRRLYGEHHADVAASTLALARLHYDRGDYDAAEPLAQRALDMHRAILGDRNLAVAHDLNVLSSIILSKGEAARALPLIREGVGIRREIQGEEDPQYLTNLNNLGLLLSQTGDEAAAESIYHDIIAIRERSGQDDPQLALTRENLAALQYLRGDIDSPVPLMRDAIAMRTRIFGAEHPDLSTPRNNLAAMLRDRGELAEAEALLRQVVDIERNVRGPDHWYVAYYEVSLALVLADKGDTREAERLLRRGLSIYSQTFTEDNTYVAAALIGLGNVLLDGGEAQEAESVFGRAASALRRTGPEGSWQIAAAESGLGAAMMMLGRSEGTELLLLRSDSVLRVARGERSAVARRSAARLVTFYENAGRADLVARFRSRAGPGR